MSQHSNFCFPIHPLANDRVKLVPFSPDHHAKTFISHTVNNPSLYAHMPSGPYPSPQEFTTHFLEQTSFPNPGWFTFAIIDLTRRRRPSPEDPEDPEGELAGMISFMDTSPAHLSTEIGCIVILPPYQRTHVTTNAVGLMLRYALDGPEKGGIGLRRVQWRASSMNAASIKAAERLGFQKEGVLRWHMVMRGEGKVGNGRALLDGSEKGDYGRDTVVLGLCWDDWVVGGGRERVGGLMARTE